MLLGMSLFCPSAHVSDPKLLVNTLVVRQVEERSIHSQQLMPMITQVIDLLIKAAPNDVIELQEAASGAKFRRDLLNPPLVSPADVELLVLRLPEEAVSISRCKALLAHP